MPVSEVVASALEDLGRRVAEAVARGEFETARALTEEAIRIRAGETRSTGEAPVRGSAD